MLIVAGEPRKNPTVIGPYVDRFVRVRVIAMPWRIGNGRLHDRLGRQRLRDARQEIQRAPFLAFGDAACAVDAIARAPDAKRERAAAIVARVADLEPQDAIAV